MTVIQISQFRELKNAPLIAMVDLQVEYVSTGRAYAINDIDSCLANCRALLDRARRMGLPIAHFRQLRPSPYFNCASKFSDWIEDFRPKTTEMVFERALPSCYSNAGFCSFLERLSAPTIILAGLTGEEACLCTAVDALHRNHKLIFVQDASASHAIGKTGEADSHEFVSNLMSVYGTVISTGDLTRQFKLLSLRAS